MSGAHAKRRARTHTLEPLTRHGVIGCALTDKRQMEQASCHAPRDRRKRHEKPRGGAEKAAAPRPGGDDLTQIVTSLARFACMSGVPCPRLHTLYANPRKPDAIARFHTGIHDFVTRLDSGAKGRGQARTPLSAETCPPRPL